MEENGTKRLNIEISEEERKQIKIKAAQSGISIRKYVRLKLGLDKQEKGK